MKIVGVCACVAGIAHTYLAKEKLINAASKRGHEIKVETQGVIGIENELTEKEIKEADVVILAVDVSVSKRNRFDGKKIIEISTSTVVQSSDKLIEKIEKLMEK
ncbi:MULTISPECIES: PTS fructose transporter subunit IIB [Peptoniphilaceae]|uniref:PTS system mannose-specific EIIBCA component n=1 Tax=Anaerococcus vaginalis TaxID=33037 RepID=A0A6N2TBG4_9FIRM|nr:MULTISPECIES: PTS fructose transporter subunit IIB [Peptoniphilaceae]MBS6921434.1 fructose PTS transporter subunit IIB [Anaerococcus vaginalis]MDU1707194.1 PTS fructose transporter subunit IIB [Anaerococcus vaginalis]MDU1763315.1 PTS fructose transporter subunit IIB [Anaerococcus vaginalis]MDU2649318.1 PTS fructose transporter subunit IIB [Anaerococcus vaginalis]MDU5460764.1 PTS fructose transporter subunit IIB [Anaerococcus vaginalis]